MLSTVLLCCAKLAKTFLFCLVARSKTDERKWSLFSFGEGDNELDGSDEKNGKILKKKKETMKPAPWSPTLPNEEYVWSGESFLSLLFHLEDLWMISDWGFSESHKPESTQVVGTPSRRPTMEGEGRRVCCLWRVFTRYGDIQETHKEEKKII